MRNRNVLHKPKDDSYSFNLNGNNENFSCSTIYQNLEEFIKNLKTQDLTQLSFADKKAIKNKILNIISFFISESEKKLNSQLNNIITHPRFEQLESSWRGLRYLVGTALPSSEVKIRVLNVAWDILSKDLSQAFEFDQSQVFKKIYEEEFGTPGGEPYGLLIGDYYLTLTTSGKKRKSDLETLKALSGIAAASFAPFVTSITPNSLGLQSFEDMHLIKNIGNVFKHNDYNEWNRLREEEDSRFIGLVLPQVLMRKPYRTSGSFLFEKNSDKSNGPYEQAQYLWGNASYCFASLAARTFFESGWFFSMRGLAEDELDAGMVEGACKALYEVEHRALLSKPILNTLITSRFARDIEKAGFLVLCAQRNLPVAAFFNCPSAQKAKNYDRESATFNARLSIMLNNILSVSRFAHYIKVLIRDKLGQFTSPQEIENYLQNWLLKYTAANDTLTSASLVKYPLKAFNLKIGEIQGEPMHYMCIVYLQPQSEIGGLDMEFKIKFNLK